MDLARSFKTTLLVSGVMQKTWSATALLLALIESPSMVLP